MTDMIRVYISSCAIQGYTSLLSNNVNHYFSFIIFITTCTYISNSNEKEESECILSPYATYVDMILPINFSILCSFFYYHSH